MPTLEPDDTVKVRNGSIVGTVERTHLNHGSDSIDISDFLIIAHVEVPQRVIIEFATSGGIPPKGYVFVAAAEDAQGAFLAAEDDLELLSRSFDLGDSVKRNDGLIGTVVDVSDTFDIQPRWLLRGEQLKHISEIEGDVSSLSITNVPSCELKAAADDFGENFVSVDHWVGIVQEFDVDVVIRLENDSIVSITNPSDLFLPITDLDKPLIHLPDYDNISRPHTLSAFGGWSSVIATSHPEIGSFVVTSRTAIKSGRWLVGSFDRNVPHQGRVIAVVQRSIDVDWLVCNPFAPLRAKDVRRPREEIEVYKNIDTYSTGDQLHRIDGLRIFDLSQSTGPSITSLNTSTQPSGSLVNIQIDLRVGYCVRFRDLTGAAVKYQNPRGCEYGFRKIRNERTGGWDINVFSVMGRKQVVKILWYNGDVSAVSSNELTKYGTFDEDLRPTNIVVNRSGLEMRPPMSAEDQPPGMSTYVEFNEMKFFEKPHDLRPQKVGIIQSVDARERVATVRWYEHPHIVIQDAGTYLSESSTFESIGSTIEEISIYEVMKFPALEREYHNLVIIPPQYLSQSTFDIVQQGESQRLWRAILSAWNSGIDPGDANVIFHGARERIRSRLFLHTMTRKPEGLADDSTAVDWVGEVVGLGLDGSVTVRLSGADRCRDAIVSFDHVLGTIDLDNIPADDGQDDEASVDLMLDDVSDASTISESIEYEGGERLDSDENDENWESAEEGVPVMDDDIDMPEAAEPEQPASVSIHGTDSSLRLYAQSDTQPIHEPGFHRLLSYLPNTSPPCFEVLDIPPPTDQHQITNLKPPSTSALLKRMRYEHKILASSLPPTIYVRTYESNLSLLRCLIIGPRDTPYEHAPFVFDLVLPSKYPSEPPIAHFLSWSAGLGRINPNLYEEGKICLSLLGTWPGQASKEQWSKEATILQLLISLQGLVMVPKPFYNEAGFEDYRNEKGYENESMAYSEKAYVMARGFVKHALTHPPGGLEDILAFTYFPPPSNDGMFEKVIERARKLIAASTDARKQQGQDNQDLSIDGAGQAGTEAFLRPLSKGAMVMLNRLLNELGDCLNDTRKVIDDMHSKAQEPMPVNAREEPQGTDMDLDRQR